MINISTEFTCECGKKHDITIGDMMCPRHLGTCSCGRYYMLEVVEDYDLDDDIPIPKEEPEFSISVSPVSPEIAQTLLEKESTMFVVNLSDYDNN